MSFERTHPYPTGTKAVLRKATIDNDDDDNVRNTPVGAVVTVAVWSFHGGEYQYLVFCDSNGATLNYSQTEADAEWEPLLPLSDQDIDDIVRRLRLYCELGVGDLRELEPMAEQIQTDFPSVVSKFRTHVNRQRLMWALLDKQHKEGKL